MVLRKTTLLLSLVVLTEIVGGESEAEIQDGSGNVCPRISRLVEAD